MLVRSASTRSGPGRCSPGRDRGTACAFSSRPATIACASASSQSPPYRHHRHSSRWTSPCPTTRPLPRPLPRRGHDASRGQSSSPASSPSTSPAAVNAAAACVSSRSSPMPTPSPESSTAPALPLRLLLLDRSCCSPDRAPLRRRVHPPAPCCRPHCPARALAAHFVMRALPLAPTTVPKSPDRALPRRSPGCSVLTLAPNSHFETLKRAPGRGGAGVTPGMRPAITTGVVARQQDGVAISPDVCIAPSGSGSRSADWPKCSPIYTPRGDPW